MYVIVVLFVLALVMTLLSRCLHVVPLQTVDVVELVGRRRALEPGLHWVLPGIERIESVDMGPRSRTVVVECRTVDASTTCITLELIEHVTDPIAVIEHRHVVENDGQLRHAVGSIVAHRSDEDTRLKRDELADHIRWQYEPLRRRQGIAVESLTIGQVAFEPVVARSQLAVLLAQNERAVRILNAETEAVTARKHAETEAAVIKTRDDALRDVDERSLEWKRLETIQTALPDATMVVGHLPWQPPRPGERRPPPSEAPGE